MKFLGRTWKTEDLSNYVLFSMTKTKRITSMFKGTESSNKYFMVSHKHYSDEWWAIDQKVS